MAERKVSLEISAKVTEALKAFREMEQSVSQFGKSNEAILADLEKTDEKFAGLSKATKDLADSVSELKKLQAVADSFSQLQKKAEDTAVELQAAEQAVKRSQTSYAAAANAAKQATDEYNRLKATLASLSSEQDQIAARQKQLAATLDIANKVQETEARIEDYNDTLRLLSSEADRAARRQARLRQELEYNASIDREGMSKDRAGKLNAQARSIEKALDAIGKYLAKNADQQAEVRASIDSTVASFDQLGKSAARRGVDVRELLVPVQTLQAELQSLGARAQETAARMQPIQGSLNLAKAAATETARGLTSAGNELAKAETKFKSVGSAGEKLQAALNPLAAQLRQAGLSTRDMASTQSKLATDIDKTSKALRSSEAAMRGYANQVKNASDEKRKFLENGRTALSFVQRIRSEVLSAASGFLGLYAAVNQVRAAFQTAAQVQGARNALLPLNQGDTELVAEELAYVKDLADRTSQSFTVLAAQYAKVRASAQASGMSLNAQRAIFEGIVTAAAGMQIGTQNLERSLYAVGQILNKTKLSSEELNGQLGDALPGAMALLSEATGKTAADLMKMMENGELTSEVLISMAATANTKFGPALAKALAEPEAAMVRYTNTVDALRVLFRDTAKESGLTQAIDNITRALNSEETVRGIQALAKGFVTLLETIPSLITAINSLLPALAGIGGVIGIKVLATLTGMTTGVTGLTMAVKGLWAAMFGWVGVIAFAVSALVTLYQTSDTARGIIGTAFIKMKDAADGFVTGINVGLKKSEKFLASLEYNINRLWNSVIKLTAGLYRALGAESIAGLMESTWTVAEKDIKKRIANLDRDIANLEEQRKKNAEQNDKELWDLVPKQKKAEPDPKRPDFGAAREEQGVLADKNKQKKDAEAAAKEKEKLNKQLADDLLRIDKELYGARADLADDEMMKLELRLKEIAAAYQDEIDKFTKAGDVEAVKKVQELIKVKQDVERKNTLAIIATREKKDVDAELKDADKLRREITNQWNGLQDDILRIQRDIYKAKGDLVGSPAGQLANDMEAVRENYTNLINQLVEVRDSASSSPEQKAGAEQAIADVKELIKLKQTVLAIDASIRSAEKPMDEIEDIYAKQARDIEVINNKRENGLLTELQAEKAILAIQNDKVEEIREQAKLGVEAASAVVDAAGATEEQVKSARKLREEYEQILRLTEKQKYQLFKGAELNQQMADGLSDGLIDAGKALGDVVNGTKNWAEAWSSLRDIMREFFADLLLNISKTLAQNAFMQLLQGGEGEGGGAGGFLAGLLNRVPGGSSTPTNKPEKAPADGDSAAKQKATESAFGGLFDSLGTTINDAWDSFSGLFSAKTDQNTQATEQGSQNIVSGLAASLVSGFNSVVAAIFTSSASETGASALGSATGAIVAHRGAVVGRPHGSNRTVPSSVFASARYYHSGGVVGLKRDEYPAILKRNEEVLTEKDPRNVLNGGGAAQAPANVKIINAIDSASVMQHALSSSNGQKAIINFMRSNKSAIKSVLA